ncbi:4-(cytidine 5'-diphospho)-2-C-methyl-D-erythritol kinase [Virgibacillus halodenitrificans]|uniref:4-(cytidine 5'-diphospho)-2-C-methyl-D-erythritol kinase n=1 Tax=Virgibacillus halodenitrificans TaxID=1482 RepID=UPI0003189053|nr:4-(cytidine 5'-diphospho)-2-C-methyl-D-erythritol kinase [Virgibacillus halodenitrificans]MCG1030322.1 4-(cytidine 5'-diphospho)-2-C-methyl-D-erythritol kinase [Virgibacillus halodenitrificans]MCJ0931638.1 4-(cytidine 5'-diphospho)-2-C-methyl-D-erythritol kinase [Virgibacillus halodenitrificans]MYL44354.1 4-(cytidine 5'-diphospho)-2-C-methyl-D-erythritol kinase [Virgibacillus halodenitrificans]WHX25524.1 4-(cytidine 5'-diphospho)-2-C-methyl-D-erythritol kinase [Virgibacillus halodenitrifican
MALFENAPAKINLSLDVLSKRDDGYHNVEMIMTTIDLSDRVMLSEIAEDRIEVALESRYVPSDERNLAYKAAKVFKDTYRIRKGVRINIEKSIPVSAGLGGGSTDAAAVLRGLNRLWSLNIPTEKLQEMGDMIGTDVPFCVQGKTAIATGRGEKIERLPSPPPGWVVLAKPDIGVSSRTIFQRIDMKEISHPNTSQILRALNSGDFQLMCDYIGNSLEAITMNLHPEVLRIKKAMVQAGASGVLMSGSGPTVYGLVEHHSKARRIYNSMCGFCDEVYLVRLLG